MSSIGIVALTLCGLLFAPVAIAQSASPLRAAPVSQSARPPQAAAKPTLKKPEQPLRAQDNDDLLRGQNRVQANAGTVSIMTNRVLGGPIMTAVLDLSTLLDEGERFEKMRILPVVARGKMQNLWDILYLSGIDLGFLQSDSLEFLKDDPQIKLIKDKVRYIAVMFPEEIHIIARNEIQSLRDLEGKKVSINAKGTGSSVAGPVIFRRLNINAQLEYEDGNRAIERMKSGELAAHVYVLAKPAAPVAAIKAEGLHMLPVPFTDEFLDVYAPSELTSKDYPNLIQGDQRVETLAVGNLLAVFNWPEGSERYKKVARFVDAFFTRFPELQKPGFQPGWKAVNLAAVAPGWTRFKPAQDWLDRHPLEKSDKTALREKFDAFIAQRKDSNSIGTLSQGELFQQFLDWQKKPN
jgi:TRAP-type uncharacterized transport system substrate-binding protein